MRHVVILRESQSDHGTFGRLFTDHGYQCRTLELPWRDNKSNLSNIPVGHYRSVYLERSASGFYRHVYHIKGVPGRVGVLIHSGNYAGDTTKSLQTHSHGCILLGTKSGVIGKQKAIFGSKLARRLFIEDMDGAEMMLHIIEATGGSNARTS